MTYAEVLENAKKTIGPNCKVCPVCNGLGCGNTIPGPGSKYPGTGTHDNWEAWQKIRIEMDTIVPSMSIDTSTEFMGVKCSLPLIAAPVGALDMQFNKGDDIREYNDGVFKACAEKGIIGTFGDGLSPLTLPAALESGKKYGTAVIPVLNPLSNDEIKANMDKIRGYGCPAVSVVVDSAGLPHLRNSNSNAGVKSVADLRELRDYADMPFIIKGVLNAKAAEKAVEAGADAVVVSNHGGRVLAYAPATADVLPEIVEAVGGKTKIIVDGGIRSGADIFKAIALGADAVMICRPFLVSWYGGGAEGAGLLIDKLRDELSDVMYMAGTPDIKSIGRENVRTH